MLGVMILAPITPSLIRELGLKEIHSGILISTGSIMTAVMAPIWGNISDRRGRKPVILFGLAGLAISTVLLTIVFYSGLHGWLIGGWLLFWMIFLRSVVGMFIPGILSASQALMGDETNDKERTKGMALISAANGLGLILGPAIAGVFSLLSLLWPMYIGIIVTAVAWIVISFMMPATKPQVRNATHKIKWHQPGLRLYLTAAFVTMISLFTIQVIGGFYLQDRLALTSEQMAWSVSLGLMVTGLAILVVQLVQSKWLKWNPVTLILYGSMMLIVSMLVFLLTMQLSSYYIAFLLLGAGAGLMMTGFMTGASLAVSSDQQGSVAGLVTAVQGLSAIIAPILSTSLYQVEHRIPMAGIALLCVMLGLLMLRKTITVKTENQITS
jgi:MFS family permease